jgi:hypothetical protein
LWKTSLLLPALALVTACHDAPARRATGPRETPVMRVVYRDAHDRMLLTFPRDGDAAITTRLVDDECHAPLLIDGQTGAARRLSAREAMDRTHTMQLAGATPGFARND